MTRWGASSKTWTPEEDSALAETVLKFVRNGGHQLDAFDEAAVFVRRTPGACGFRWNTVLRAEFQEEFAAAKDERIKASLRSRKRIREPLMAGAEPSLGELISSLKMFEFRYREMQDRVRELEKSATGAADEKIF